MGKHEFLKVSLFMTDTRTFKYGKLSWLAALLSAAVLAMTVVALVSAAKTFNPSDLIYFVVGVPSIAVFLASGMLAYRDVVISSEGVGRSLFGVRTELVPWHEIASVRCGVLSGHDKSVGSYHFRRRNRVLFGGVRVMTMIDDVDLLVARVGAEVLKRSIPVTAWDGDTLVTLDRLPSPIKGRAAWT